MVVDLKERKIILSKLVWNFISTNDKEDVFNYLQSYKSETNSTQDKEQELIMLFSAYNKYVSYDFPEVTSLSCVSAVKTVIDFFEDEFIKNKI